MLQELLANAEARLAGVRAKSGWGARFGSFLAGSFVTRIVRKLSVTVSCVRQHTLCPFVGVLVGLTTIIVFKCFCGACTGATF